MQAKHRVLVTRNTEINLKKVSIVYDFQSTSHKILDGHHEECTLINIPVYRLEPIENEDRFFTNGRYFWHSTVLSSSFMPLEVKKMKQRPPYGSRFFIALSDEGELMIIHTADEDFFRGARIAGTNKPYCALHWEDFAEACMGVGIRGTIEERMIDSLLNEPRPADYPFLNKYFAAAGDKPYFEKEAFLQRNAFDTRIKCDRVKL